VGLLHGIAVMRAVCKVVLCNFKIQLATHFTFNSIFRHAVNREGIAANQFVMSYIIQHDVDVGLVH